jgi:hypothetical protein
MTEITFLGHLISADGIKPDPRKIEATLKMLTPASNTELQRFLGMTNYLGKFLPNLSKETAPYRPFQDLFRHIAGGAKHWGERAANPWLPYILLTRKYMHAETLALLTKVPTVSKVLSW